MQKKFFLAFAQKPEDIIDDEDADVKVEDEMPDMKQKEKATAPTSEKVEKFCFSLKFFNEIPT